ncbi:DUF1761 domain-containing protein [Candidatus Kaiserbacteria bacterium]|nr:MAG: DUF1761 domain-containing protein [Candidatus Kaiserbacteria bacterium]
MFSSINEIAVLVAAILAVAVESIWYSPLLFGSVWKKSIGHTEYTEDISTLHMVRATAYSVVVYAFFFACAVQVMNIMDDNQTFFQGAGLICLLLIGSLILLAHREFRSWRYMAVHGVFIVITFFGGVGVIMYWPW